MIYSFTLSQVAIGLGVIYLITHGFALCSPKAVVCWLEDFPRNTRVGIGLMVAAALWFGWILSSQDLMDFSPYRNIFLIGITVIGVCTVMFLQEYIAVRALGILLLLFANVLLDAAFTRQEVSRLLITLTAYFYVIFGMFWVGAPYLMRDQLRWLCSKTRRLKIASGAGVVFGSILLFFGVFIY